MTRRLTHSAALLLVLTLAPTCPTQADNLYLSGAELDALLQDDSSQISPDLTAGETVSAAPRRWWPIGLSALLPGLGEVTTGHMRGIPLIAVDGAIWYGVYKKTSDGNDKEDEFEAFALQHWSEEEWEIALANGDLEPFFPDYGVGTPKTDVPLYVPREVDEREWFENAGKWDEFAWGWREYWQDGYAPQAGLPDTWFYSDNPTMTPLRKEYISMREASNDDFKTRDTLLSAALLLRVFSVLQMVYLEGFVGRRYDAADATEFSLATPRASWSASSDAGGSGMVAWKMTW